MWYILLAAAVFVIYRLLNVRTHYVKGMKYWAECAQTLTNLLQKGYDEREALLEISKARHPELNETTHRQIVDKFPDLNDLVPFIYDILEFRSSLCSDKGRKLSDKWALTLIGQAQVPDKGNINNEIPERSQKVNSKAYELGENRNKISRENRIQLKRLYVFLLSFFVIC